MGDITHVKDEEPVRFVGDVQDRGVRREDIAEGSGMAKAEPDHVCMLYVTEDTNNCDETTLADVHVAKREVQVRISYSDY